MKNTIALSILVILITIVIVLVVININTDANYIIENELEKELVNSDDSNFYDLINSKNNIYFFETSYDDNYEITKKYINKYDLDGNQILRKDINSHNGFGNIASIFKSNSGIGEYHFIHKDIYNEDDYYMEIQLYNSDLSQINSFIPHEKIKGGIFGFDENNTYLLTSERTIIKINGEEGKEIEIKFSDEIKNITSNFFAVLRYTFDNVGFTVCEKRQLYYITYKVDYSGNILWYHIEEDKPYIPCFCENDGNIIIKTISEDSYKYAFIDMNGNELWSSKKIVNSEFNPISFGRIGDKYIVLDSASNGKLKITLYGEKFNKQLATKIIDNLTAIDCLIDENGRIYAIMKDAQSKQYYLNKYLITEIIK